MSLNKGRIWLGGLAGGVVWVLWSFVVGKFIITDARYAAAQASGLFLKTPRYPFFAGQWIIIGCIAGFPLNFAQATWSPIDRAFPWGWMMDLWVGSILATLVAGVIYKD